jgi:hypothetical protein
MTQKLRENTRGHWDGEFTVDCLVITEEQLERYEEAALRVRDLSLTVEQLTRTNGTDVKIINQLDLKIDRVRESVLAQFNFTPDAVIYDDPEWPFKVAARSNFGEGWDIQLLSRVEGPAPYPLEGRYSKISTLVQGIGVLFGKKVADSMFKIVRTLPHTGGKKATNPDEK